MWSVKPRHLVGVVLACNDALGGVQSAPHVVMRVHRVLEVFLSRVDDGVPESQRVDPVFALEHGFHRLFQAMTSMMVQWPEQEVRTATYHSLRHLLRAFDVDMRYNVLSSGIRECPFAPAVALFLNLLKDELSANWDHPVLRSPGVQELISSTLQAERGDLLTQLDVVQGALNFYRFLLIREDQADDKTLVHARSGVFAKRYLQPLDGRLRAALVAADATQPEFMRLSMLQSVLERVRELLGGDN